ncbi:MAG TPA: alpha/beta hydrolase [Ruminiclostridium sp.]|jgi:hypothetical protein|nr:alpha/beta hydrolase [Ruminiclostridium sp.]
MWIFYCILIAFIILALICCYFYRLAVRPGKKPFLSGNKDLPEVFLGGITAEGKEWLDKVDKSHLAVKSCDGLNLKAFLISSSRRNDKVFVVMAHGYNSKGLDLGPYAKFFNEEMGFHVLLPDDRGHGQSDGDYIGFGWHDRVDYLTWIKYLIKTFGEDIKILLFGVSMGGAAVLMLSGEKLPENVKGIISDCAYTSALAVLDHQLKVQYGLPPFPIMHMTSLITKLRAGYFLGAASALRQVKKAKLPILFIHGKEDRFVPFKMVYELYEACTSDKKLFVVEGARHAESFIIDNDGYRETAKEFIRSIL